MKITGINKQGKKETLIAKNRAAEKSVTERKNSPHQTWTIENGYKLYTKQAARKEMQKRLSFSEIAPAPEIEDKVRIVGIYKIIIVSLIISCLSVLSGTTYKEIDFKPLKFDTIERVKGRVLLDGVSYNTNDNKDVKSVKKVLIVKERNLFGSVRTFVELY